MTRIIPPFSKTIARILCTCALITGNWSIGFSQPVHSSSEFCLSGIMAVTDMTGQRLDLADALTPVSAGEIRLDARAWPVGVYFIFARLSSGDTEVIRVMKR